MEGESALWVIELHHYIWRIIPWNSMYTPSSDIRFALGKKAGGAKHFSNAQCDPGDEERGVVTSGAQEKVLKGGEATSSLPKTVQIDLEGAGINASINHMPPTVQTHTPVTPHTPKLLAPLIKLNFVRKKTSDLHCSWQWTPLHSHTCRYPYPHTHEPSHLNTRTRMLGCNK